MDEFSEVINFDLMFNDFFDDENNTEAENEVTSLETNLQDPNIQSNNTNKLKRRFEEVDIDNFLAENENKRTKAKTENDLKVFYEFLNVIKEERPIQLIPAEELNEYLCRFIVSVKKKNGEDYEPTSLRSFISSIDRKLKSLGSTMSINKDAEFNKTIKVLKSKQKELKKKGHGNKPQAAECLSDDHLTKMFSSGTLGPNSGKALIHSMWLICTTYFGMRTGTEVHNLKWGDIQIDIDDECNLEYIVLRKERQTKTRTGANARDIRQNQPRAYAIHDDPLRDPVSLYKKYMEMRPLSMLHDEAPFLLSIASPNQRCWFKSQPMGINKIYSIMNEMKADAGIEDSKIKPYSARKRLIQKLSDEGVSPNQIVQISGHKNVNSLNNYSYMNNRQARSISNILSSSSSSTVTHTASIETQESANSTSLPQNAASGPFSRGFLINPIFQGNVTFNFHDNSNKSNSLGLSQVTRINDLNP